VVARIGTARNANSGEWRGRVDNARALHHAAEKLLHNHQPGANGNPIIVLIVHAAIAYGDALTAFGGGKINQKDHAQLPKLVATALGPRSNAEQVKRLARILSEKDAASCGSRVGRMEHTSNLLEQLDRFARWAEDVLGEA
jgi:hypothetical protein